jgi:purine-cytosine permease-like protein
MTVTVTKPTVQTDGTYWIGPWPAVMFADQYLRRGQNVAGFLYDRSYSNWNGLLSFVIGLVVSVALFSNQEKFVGWLAKAYPELGDVTFFVGFLLSCAAYLVLCRSKIAAERVAV